MRTTPKNLAVNSLSACTNALYWIEAIRLRSRSMQWYVNHRTCCYYHRSLLISDLKENVLKSPARVTCVRTLNEHEDSVEALAVYGDFVLSAAWDGTVKASGIVFRMNTWLYTLFNCRMIDVEGRILQEQSNHAMLIGCAGSDGVRQLNVHRRWIGVS